MPNNYSKRKLDTTHGFTPSNASQKRMDLKAMKATPSLAIGSVNGVGVSDDDQEMVMHHKKEQRILANRDAARASYIRRKKMISELQATVRDQSSRYTEIEVENSQLRQEIKELREVISAFLLSRQTLRQGATFTRSAMEFNVVADAMCSADSFQAPVVASQTHPTSSVETSLVSRQLLVGLLTGSPPRHFGTFFDDLIQQELRSVVNAGRDYLRR